MLEQDKILSLMTKHFPRWMDIRKRAKTSNGGMYLQSLASEVVDIQQAIDEYKKDFFLINYIDDYDNIPYYVYYINIGDIDSITLTVTLPSNLSQAQSAEDFYTSTNKYYYEDSKIFFRKENVDEKSAQVKYILNNIEYSSIVSKYYVWNIYDEFAAFVGLKRFVGEDNETLTKRILNVFKCIPNSTEDGIKNAIINDILDSVYESYPNLSFDEIRNKIIIERPTPENLEYKYNEFTSILDKLADINADVYRMKTWDVDVWQFKLSGIDYLPHVWDHILAAYENGVGFDDDLKPEIIKSTETDDNNVSANISVYKQDADTMQSFLSGHSIKKNIKLQLTKYSNDLKATDIEYTIAAANPVNITNYLNDIYVSIIDTNNQCINIPLSDIFQLEEHEELYINNITQSFIKCHKDYIYEEIYPYSTFSDTSLSDANNNQGSDNDKNDLGDTKDDVGIDNNEDSDKDETGNGEGETEKTEPDNPDPEPEPPKPEYVLKDIICTYSIERINLSNEYLINTINANKINIANVTFSIINNVPNAIYEPIFVYKDDNNAEFKYDITNSHVGIFEYCYIIDKSENIYYSYNNIKSYTKNTNDVSISNNFTPVMLFENQHIYVITKTNKCSVYFQNDLNDEYIGSWSFGNCDLSIISELDYNSAENENYYFNIDINTNSPTILFSDIFTENNIELYLTSDSSDAIDYTDFLPRNLSKYSISINTTLSDSTHINYSKTYLSQFDLANDIVSTNKYVRSVRVSNIASEFIKLPHVKIDNILYVGENLDWRLGDSSSAGVQYSIQKDMGIIIFDSVPENDLYIVYTIYVPESISISIDELYKLSEYNKQAYKKIYDTNVYGITDGYIHTIENLEDISDIETYNIIVSNYPANYVPTIVNNTVIFNKLANNALSIKYGYYYYGAQEYYLLSDPTPIFEENISNVQFENTISNGSEIILHKYNENYIKNSHMNLNTISNTYAIDLTKHTDKIAHNKLGVISTCDNFYKWKTFGANLSLVSHNDSTNVGIGIEPLMKYGYAYYDITMHIDLSQEYYISLYLTGSTKAYIAKELMYDNMKFRRSIASEIVADINTIDSNNRYSTIYTQEPGYDYYLIVTTDEYNSTYNTINMFDDIIMLENSQQSAINQKKNIDILGLSIKEQVTDNDYNNRIYFDSNKYTDKYCLDIDQDGYIINACDIDWDMTKLFEYKDAIDFKNNLSVRSKVNINESGNYLYTLNDTAGRIVTNPIKLANHNLIKNLVIEINDIPFDSMSGFQTRLLVSQTEDGVYEDLGIIAYKNTDSFPGNLINGNYVKISIIMPEDKYIGSIALYAEYKTTETEQPVGAVYSYGYITSSILDSFYLTDYMVDSINISKECTNDSFNIKIRAYEDNNIWTPWKDVKTDEDGNILSDIQFKNVRYFQAMVEVLKKDTKLKINYISIKRDNT